VEKNEEKKFNLKKKKRLDRKISLKTEHISTLLPKHQRKQIPGKKRSD
jgi:hypothetical protein